MGTSSSTISSMGSRRRRKAVTAASVVAAFQEKNRRKENSEYQTVEAFVKRDSLHRDGDSHRMSYADTSAAWKALRQNHERIDKDMIPEERTREMSISSIGSEVHQNQHDERIAILSYDASRDLRRSDECNLCDSMDSRREPFHGCRVCDKVYHHECLEQKGYLQDPLSVDACNESDTEVGWSCPECENLFHLLTDSEKRKVIESFDEMAGEDTSFGLDQYIKERKISYQDLVGIPMSSMRAGQEVRFFHDMDRDNSGTVEWWEFAPTMCVRVLGLRSQEEFLNMITPREVSRLQAHFKAFDKMGKGIITLSLAKMAYGKWMLSFIKREERDHVPDDWLGALPPEWFSNTDTIHRREPKIAWEDFLLMNAANIIYARPNTLHTRPFLPTINEAIRPLTDKQKMILRKHTREEERAERIDEEDEDIDPLERLKIRMGRE